MKTAEILAVSFTFVAMLGAGTHAAAAEADASLELRMARGLQHEAPATSARNPMPVAAPPAARTQRGIPPVADSLELQMARGMNWLPAAGTTAVVTPSDRPAGVAQARP